jgi:hypothetical protein
MLNRLQSVLMHEEIFHRDIWPTLRSESSELRDLPPDVQAIAYAEGVLSQCPPGKSHVGFKMWRNQSPEACDHLLHDKAVRKIVLERENRLAAYASLSKARRTMVWNSSRQDSPGAEYAAATVAFDTDDFRQLVRRQDGLFQHYRRAARGETLHITYGGLVAGDDYRRCLEFLGLQRSVSEPADEDFVRLNDAEILSRFDERDHSRVDALITELGHPEWAATEC